MNLPTGFSPKRRRLETLTDVPAARLEALLEEYRNAGAEVTPVPQSNGLFTIQAVFLETLDLNSADAEGRPIYKRGPSKK